MKNRVRQVRLRVRAPNGRAKPAKLLAEQFTRVVMDRFCASLEARFSGRIVLLQRLTVRWDLSETRLTDPDEVARCAAELAESVSIAAEPAVSAGSQTAVVFEDDTAWLTSYLKSGSTNTGGAWYHARWHGGGLRRLLASPSGVATGVAALLRLAATGELISSLDRLPPDVVVALAKGLEIDGNASSDYLPPDSTLEAKLKFLSDRLPPHLSVEAAAVALYVYTLLQAVPAPVRDLSVHAANAALVARPPTLGCLIRAVVAPAGTPSDRNDSQPAQQTIDGSCRTPYGGLFYLLGIVLELGIGESLWKACLPEGGVLAGVAAALLGPTAEGDPATMLFGGVTAREVFEPPTVLPAQQAEVSGELLQALVHALSWKELALPLISLELVESSAGRCLLAVAAGSFILFAWPAPDAAATADGMAAFLKVWPRFGPAPQASGALSALDPTGRLCRAEVTRAPSSLTLPVVPTSAAVCLLAQICGSLAFWFAVRVASAADDALCPADTFLARFLRVPARVELEPDVLKIIMPMDRIDLDLRRAALDRDPGWISWLQRTVCFEFEPGAMEDAWPSAFPFDQQEQQTGEP